ncbi:hypothetical protein [Clostridium pasteurianum]|nr:hypothetical protein [Clostridium pasteurianum]
MPKICRRSNVIEPPTFSCEKCGAIMKPRKGRYSVRPAIAESGNNKV